MALAARGITPMSVADDLSFIILGGFYWKKKKNFEKLLVSFSVN
jgi:hypothetical protein